MPTICRDGAGAEVYGVTSVGGTSMGDVIAVGRKQPDGAKIVNLRKQKGLKQEDLANRANNISVRLLRDIERRNHPVPATTITAIATALQTTPDEITLSAPGRALAPTVPLLKLTAIWSAKDLSALATDANRYEWMLEVDPSPVTAKGMQDLMVIVRRLVTYERDDFDFQDFGEIPRLARLQELLNQLRDQGVGVIAGKYVRHSLEETKHADFSSWVIPDTKWSLKVEFILCLHFVPAEKQEGDTPIRPGKPLERLLEEARRPAMAQGVADGDEIPF
jgi:transcriptional regulator with XRE-family HTH domain